MSQQAIIDDFVGWGATTWVRGGKRYWLMPGEAVLAIVTNESDAGSVPSGWSSAWHTRSNYDEAHPWVPTFTGTPPSGESAMSIIDPLHWTGPRWRYFLQLREALPNFNPEIVWCSSNPTTSQALVEVPEDSGIELVLLPGATS